MDRIDPSQYWLHDLSPFVFQIGDSFGLRWYGLAYVLGFLVGAWLLRLYHRHGISPFDPEQQTDVFMYLIGGVILGGRVGYFIFYTPEALLTRPWEIVYVWQGGMSSHGGFIGVGVAAWLIARRFQQPLWHVIDLMSSLSPSGLLFGRIANFQNGELWGRPATVPWAVRFPDAPDGGMLPRHPSQLYEASLEGLVMLLYSQWRIWKTPVLKECPGRFVGEFLAIYAILRVVGEQFREPDEGVELTFGWLSRGTTLSVLMATIGLAIVLWSGRRRRKTSQPGT